MILDVVIGLGIVIAVIMLVTVIPALVFMLPGKWSER